MTAPCPVCAVEWPAPPRKNELDPVFWCDTLTCPVRTYGRKGHVQRSALNIERSETETPPSVPLQPR